MQLSNRRPYSCTEEKGAAAANQTLFICLTTQHQQVILRKLKLSFQVQCLWHACC